MKTQKRSGQPSAEQRMHARKKESNPFDEQEKHGLDAPRRSPGNAEEYQGNPSVQRRAPGVEEDSEHESASSDDRARG